MSKRSSLNSVSWVYQSILFSSVMTMSVLPAAVAFASSAGDSFVQIPFVTSRAGDFSIDSLVEARDAVKADLAISKILDSAAHTLSFTQRLSSDGVATTKFQDFYKGLEVLGAEVLRHKSINLESLTKHISQFDLDVKPTVSALDVVALAKSVRPQDQLEALPSLKVLPSTHGDSARLVYWVKVEAKRSRGGADLLFDAHSGHLIADMPYEMTIAPVDVYGANETCQSMNLGGSPVIPDPTECAVMVKDSNAVAQADTSSKQALENSQLTLEYYSSHHGRDSYDGSGAKIVNVVHVGDKYNNAFWNRAQMFMGYGDGDSETYKDFTLGVDVAGHELTHGITSNTAKLLYFNESGALNEAYSDFFGKIIANDGDWLIGRKLFFANSARGAIRDLKTPGSLKYKTHDAEGKAVSGPFPTLMSEKVGNNEVDVKNCGSSNDKCWVHINSTIYSHIGYLVIQAIGKARAEKLYYLTLTQYLTATSGFEAGRDATLKACAHLFDENTCGKVGEAFAASGL